MSNLTNGIHCATVKDYANEINLGILIFENGCFMGAASSSAISRNSNENQSEISFATLALGNKSTASRAIHQAQ